MPPLAGVIFATGQSYGTSNARVNFKASAMPRALQNALVFKTFFGGKSLWRHPAAADQPLSNLDGSS
jgi:hypothetical protein